MSNDNSSEPGLFVRQVLAKYGLNPYVPFWDLFLSRYSGIEKEKPSLCVSKAIANELKKAIENVGDITETMFITAVVNLEIHKFIVSDNKNVWEPRKESFSNFRLASSNLKFLVVGNIGDESKKREIYDWMIEQCDWTNSDFLSSEEEKKKLH